MNVDTCRGKPLLELTAERVEVDRLRELRLFEELSLPLGHGASRDPLEAHVGAAVRAGDGDALGTLEPESVPQVCSKGLRDAARLALFAGARAFPRGEDEPGARPAVPLPPIPQVGAQQVGHDERLGARALLPWRPPSGETSVRGLEHFPAERPDVPPAEPAEDARDERHRLSFPHGVRVAFVGVNPPKVREKLGVLEHGPFAAVDLRVLRDADLLGDVLGDHVETPEFPEHAADVDLHVLALLLRKPTIGEALQDVPNVPRRDATHQPLGVLSVRDRDWFLADVRKDVVFEPVEPVPLRGDRGSADDAPGSFFEGFDTRGLLGERSQGSRVRCHEPAEPDSGDLLVGRLEVEALLHGLPVDLDADSGTPSGLGPVERAGPFGAVAALRAHDHLGRVSSTSVRMRAS